MRTPRLHGSGGPSAAAALAILLFVIAPSLRAAPGSITWTKLDPAAAPAARSYTAMAYFPPTRQVLLFGGFSYAAGWFKDTWSWNGETWTQLQPAASPSRRREAGIAYDAVTRRLVLFGGVNDRTALGDTWTWDGTDWTKEAPSSAPSRRSGASLFTDPVTGHVVAFGGIAGGSEQGDTWMWGGTTWTQLSPAHTPSPRSGAQIALDPPTGRAVLFGGFTGGSPLFANDTWTWDGTDWTEVHPGGSPIGRYEAGFAYDAARRSVVMFGGSTIGFSLQDTWRWSGSDWIHASPASAPPARSTSMAFDRATGLIVLFGGFDDYSQVFYRDTWVV